MARSSGGRFTRWLPQRKMGILDVWTGKPCGRSKGEKRGYPVVDQVNVISSKTPKKNEKCHSRKSTIHRKKQVVKR